jgi:hypothetical protein
MAILDGGAVIKDRYSSSLQMLHTPYILGTKYMHMGI